jgi:CRISPR-associated protein Cas2
MSLTVVITRDVADRFRGFLASSMLEVAPGVYASTSLTARAREKVWSVLADWHAALGNGSISMIHPDSKADGGLSVQQLGVPPRQPVRLDGVLLMSAGKPQKGPSAL